MNSSIKMDELNQEIEETSDIQNYLASFRKEIECEDIENEESEREINGCESDPGLESTNLPKLYVYNPENELKSSPRKKAAEIIRLGSKITKDKDDVVINELSDVPGSDTIIPAIGEELHIDDQQALEMVAQFAEEAVAKASQNAELRSLDNGSSYQTVTIVPSDTNPGELSYVLFVSDNVCLDKATETVNMSLYGFNDAEQFNETFLTGQEGVKMRTIRLSTRRTPFITQNHVCNYCSYTSPKRYLLSRHMKSHSDERPHKCGVCERGFKTLASLQNHVNTHTGIRPHPCKECDSCFTTSGELVRHIRYKHTHEKPHKCTECDYASVELSKLKRHMRCHTGERPYQCPHCTYASPDTYKLKRHLRIHTGEKPYECDICQTRFTQSNSLKAHKLIHSGNKPVFRCEYCPATCGRKTDLRIHMEKLHSSDNPHRCKRCGKVFLDRYSYKIHIKSHEGEKCFKCDLCNYASISRRHLETHMLVHTDQKPFRCDECDQCFRQKQLLKRHKNIYHDPNYVRPEPKEKTHICNICSKAFRHKGNLMRHYAIHDPDATASEREVALRLGEPKKPGEDQDGEEDDYEFVKEDESEKDDQQVVVFEVIQVPSTNDGSSDDQTVAMVDGYTLMLNGGETQGYSIIQRAEDNSTDFLDFSEPVSDSEDVENFSACSSFKAGTKPGTGIQDKINDHLRSKNYSNEISPNKTFVRNSARRNKSTNARKAARVLKVVADRASSPNEQPFSHDLPDEEAILQREKELEHSRELQLQKDFADCFGFDEKEEDSYLSLNSGYQAFHSNLVSDIS